MRGYTWCGTVAVAEGVAVWEARPPHRGLYGAFICYGIVYACMHVFGSGRWASTGRDIQSWRRSTGPGQRHESISMYIRRAVLICRCLLLPSQIWRVCRAGEEEQNCDTGAVSPLVLGTTADYALEGPVQTVQWCLHQWDRE